ncbi:MAG: hypothetical protein RR937_09720 [Ruthenibacterium sp.]
MKASETVTENTAPMTAILLLDLERGVLTMSDAYFANILDYKSAMAQAGIMRSKGIISGEEYATIDTMMAAKYALSSCSLFRDNALIYRENNGNM